MVYNPVYSCEVSFEVARPAVHIVVTYFFTNQSWRKFFITRHITRDTTCSHSGFDFKILGNRRRRLRRRNLSNGSNESKTSIKSGYPTVKSNVKKPEVTPEVIPEVKPEPKIPASANVPPVMEFPAYGDSPIDESYVEPRDSNPTQSSNLNSYSSEYDSGYESDTFESEVEPEINQSEIPMNPSRTLGYATLDGISQSNYRIQYPIR